METIYAQISVCGWMSNVTRMAVVPLNGWRSLMVTMIVQQ